MANIEINENGIKRLEDFFEKNSDGDTYYVYALCDDGVPFYVGKGIGTRCLQHEISLDEALKEYIDKEITYEQENLEQIKEKLDKELTQKQKAIEKARNNNTFDIIILKYGLTEHEAFMVESSTINILKFCGYKLANIVNGHTSKVERETGEPTMARYLNDLLKECCPPMINVDDIKQTVLDDSIPFDSRYDDIIFVNYNYSYDFCINDLDIWDAVRGAWYTSLYKARKVKYVFAMHNNIIKAVFKVKKDGERFTEFEKIHSAERNLNKLEGSNVHDHKTKGDMEKIERVIQLISEQPTMKGDAEKLANILGDKASFYNRGNFLCDISIFEKDEDLQLLRKEFLNRCIDKKQLKMPQGSVKYLFQSDLGIIYEEDC